MKQSFRSLLSLFVILFLSLRPADKHLHFENEREPHTLKSKSFPATSDFQGSFIENDKDNGSLRLFNQFSYADPVTIRINCGGSTVTFGSDTWVSDNGYNTNGTGYSTSSAIANTTLDALYQSERFGNHSYTIPVSSGSYTVKLHFAEIYFSSSNSRLFNVNVENGQATLTSYDAYLQAGGKNIAKIEQFNNITVSDGALNISLTNVKDNAKISAIEVIPSAPAANTAPTVAAPIANQSLAYNTTTLAIPLTNVFADNNGVGNLTLSVSGNTNTTLVTSAQISSNTLNLSFASAQSGSSTIKVKATDAQGLFVEDDFVVTIQPPAANTAPTIASPITDKSVAAGTSSLVVPLSSVFTDNNGFAGLTLSVSGNSNTTLVNSAVISSGSLTLGFASGQTGSSTIKIKATDAQGLFVEDEFIVQVNTAPATTIRINCGGSSVTFGSDTWVSDNGYYTNGAGYATSSAIANTTLDALYQSERFGNHSYSIPVSNGSYTVKLHFAEIYFSNSNSRLFNVNVENGQATLSSYDVYLQAGGINTAKIEQFNNITVSDGALNITLTNVKDNAKISAIEVISAAPAANTAPTVAAPIANQSLAYNTTTLAIPLANVFADNNGVGNLTLSVSGNTNTTLVTSAQISSNTLNLSFASAQSGNSTIKVKATDAQGLFVEDDFVVTIQPPAANTAPTIASPITDKSVTAGTNSLVVPLSSVFTDNNGFASLTLSVSGNSNTTLVNSAVISSGSLTLGFASGQTGSSTIKIKATDAQGLFVEDEFIVQVNGTPATVVRINAGGGSVAYGAEIWNADQYYSGGSTYTSANSITSTTQDELYQSERWGSLSYNIPVPNGAYTLRLHFAEIVYNNSGQRVFNINIENGAASISNMDIFARAGAANKAHVEEFNNLQVTDGTLNIVFTNVVDNAKISAIEVLSNATGGANQAPVSVAGSDTQITLPENSVSLNGNNSYDPDGTISLFQWSKQSGPDTYTIVNSGSQGTAINGLVAGTYVFRLTVTDNLGATGFDDVTVVVNEGQSSSPTTTFIPLQSSWKYLDNGTNQGTSWRGTGFNDNSWSTGNAELGFGDGDESTVINFGSQNNKYITTYFRKSITINNPASFGNFSLGVFRDDGIVVYVNGTEVYRNNMPTGTISNTTLASSAASDDGNTMQSVTLPVTAFSNGTNVIAVEMHQNVQTSTDLSFDLQLIGNEGGGSGSVQILRGPYLQMGSSTAVTLRWRTDVPTDTKISVGTSVGSYTLTASNSTQTTEHEIRITGLNADTKYYYSFGSSTQNLQAGSSNYFRTAPPISTTRKIGFAAFGDCGQNQNGFQSGTLSSYQNYVGSNPADLLLLLGDNAYDFGTEQEYTSKFFNVYSPNILKNHVMFPSPGNHDYDNVSQQSRTHEYYKAFTMPTNGESGGVASGTEAFYSYNWGNVHFLSLDSYGQEGQFRLYDTTGPQVTWIKNDLAANTRMWTVVYFHHPPYTMGSHSSDTENELLKLRENLVRIFERFGVDMVIAGHSHDYERSYLMKNHYGNENSFDIDVHAVTSSSGNYNGSNNSCAYITSSGHVKHGTVYIVAGSSGADGGVQNGYPHNAMPFSIDDGGMFYFEVEGNRLDAKFLRRDGAVADQFTMMKDAGKTSTLNIVQGNSITLTASWIGNYQWSNGATSRSITVSPNSTTTYTCSDPGGCINDIFQVVVNSGSRKMQNAEASSNKTVEASDKEWTLYPVPVKRGQQLAITGSGATRFELQVVNKEGKTIHTATAGGRYLLETSRLSSGIYYVRIFANNKSIIRKFMIID